MTALVIIYFIGAAVWLIAHLYAASLLAAEAHDSFLGSRDTARAAIRYAKTSLAAPIWPIPATRGIVRFIDRTIQLAHDQDQP